MAVRPETLSTRSGDVAIAYQVTGDGPFDVVFIPPFVTHVELVWTTSFAPDLRAFSSFCRLIRFDKRGTGMSDRVGGSPTLETRMDDARAVTDAAGSSRAAFFGSSVGAAMSLLFGRDVPGPDSHARPEERLSPHDVGARLPVAPDREERSTAERWSAICVSSGHATRHWRPCARVGRREEAEPDRVLATVLLPTLSAGASARPRSATAPGASF